MTKYILAFFAFLSITVLNVRVVLFALAARGVVLPNPLSSKLELLISFIVALGFVMATVRAVSVERG